MCMTCGGRCLLCGEPSVFVHEAPPETGLLMQVYACVEHDSEVRALAQKELTLRLAAPYN